MSLPDVEGSLVLTSSGRLASWLLHQYGEKQSSSGLLSWPTPSILPLSAWLRQKWSLSWPNRFVLSNLQSLRLWESILRFDPETSKTNLLHREETAKRALAAFRLALEYRLPLTHKNFDWNRESQSFLGWTGKYNKRLESWKALDGSMLLDEVRLAMRSGRIPFPEEKIILAGFDQITPQMSDWIEMMENEGTQIEEWPPPQNENDPVSYENVELREYPDPTEETVQCARWVRSGTLPGKKIGVVVPGLPLRRNQIHRELSAELSPESVLPWKNTEPLFTISQGSPLHQEPPIHLALLLISLPSATLPFEKLSIILKSPFLVGGVLEAVQRNQADWKLRQYATANLDEIEIEGAPQWKKITGPIKEIIQNQEKSGALDWAELFSGFLRKTGWPAGDSQISDRLNQIHEAWTQCLDGFASLDRVMGKMGRTTAAKALTRIVEEKSFQWNNRERSIQVIDIDEAGGMEFDSLWVMGCSADALPAQPSPNPFIPVPLQREFKLPHNGSDRELEAAENRLSGLLASAREIVFTYPAWDGPVENTPSPLLKNLPRRQSSPTISDSSRLIDKMARGNLLEFWTEPDVILPEANPDANARAGTGILKDQAGCPFRAFAIHRLGAETRIIPETDYEAANRGTVVHKALELFWMETGNRLRLNNLMREGKLDTAILKSVEKALKIQLKNTSLKSQPRFVAMETENLAELLRKWLEFEQTRPDFEVVFSEERAKIILAGMELNVRPDRMDRLSEGEKIIVDYKTGIAEPAGWFDNRIQEPQLPLYALKFKPQAIAFALIKKTESKMTLKAAFDESANMKIFSDPKTRNHAKDLDWDEIMNFWEERLTKTANQFVQGNAEVDPFDTRKTCRNCGLESFCRINELAGQTIEDEE